MEGGVNLYSFHMLFYKSPFTALLLMSVLKGRKCFCLQVLGAIASSKRLRRTGNLFIANLAIADLCVTSIVNPFSIIGK